MIAALIGVAGAILGLLGLLAVASLIIHILDPQESPHHGRR